MQRLKQEQAKRQTWHMIISPCTRLICLLSELSAEFALHCVTGLESSQSLLKHAPALKSQNDMAPNQGSNKRIVMRTIVNSYLLEMEDNRAFDTGLRIAISLIKAKSRQAPKTKHLHKARAQIGHELLKLCLDSSLFVRLAIALGQRNFHTKRQLVFVATLVKFLLYLLKAQPDDPQFNAIDQMSVSRICHLAKSILSRVLRIKKSQKVRGYNLKTK